MNVPSIVQCQLLSRNVRRLIVGFAMVALLCGSPFESADAGDAAQTPAAPQAAPSITWGGLGWGIGIATDFDLTGARVANATIVNNIVRVTDTSSNVGISFVLEAHYFLRDYRFGLSRSGMCDPANDRYNCTELAHGPFVAIEVGDGSSSAPAANGPITAYAMGWMVGMRHPLTTTSSSSSWNFGLGLRVTPKSQVLGDGFFANLPPPAGETAIRYKTEPRFGLTLLSSFSF